MQMKKTIMNISLIFAMVISMQSMSVYADDSVNGKFEYMYDRFPDFGYMVKPEELVKNYPNDMAFRLSDNYPDRLYDLSHDVKKILKMPFEKHAMDYAITVRDYVFKNNIDPTNNALSFNFGELRGQDREWFHMPWQHWGKLGREGFHGLTREGPLKKNQLGRLQNTASFSYAVGFYNKQAGYAVGRVWKDRQGPDLTYIVKNGFPTGSIFAKFLFTTLDETQVPYLKNPVEWNAYVYRCDAMASDTKTKCSAHDRVTTTVRLLQMDIMVKDPRATKSNGWVFVTFVYNGGSNADQSAYKNKNEKLWAHLQPVGVMWGNDPGNTTNYSNPMPTKTIINHKLKETVINPAQTLPPQHLGWNGRLNGPADSPQSSCMSCHSTAQFPAVSQILPIMVKPKLTPGSSMWMRWFRNFTPQQYRGFNPGEALPTDFSLQLSQSIRNFVQYRNVTEKGHFEGEYWSHPITRGVFEE